MILTGEDTNWQGYQLARILVCTDDDTCSEHEDTVLRLGALLDHCSGPATLSVWLHTLLCADSGGWDWNTAVTTLVRTWCRDT